MNRKADRSDRLPLRSRVLVPGPSNALAWVPPLQQTSSSSPTEPTESQRQGPQAGQGGEAGRVRRSPGAAEELKSPGWKSPWDSKHTFVWPGTR